MYLRHHAYISENLLPKFPLRPENVLLPYDGMTPGIDMKALSVAAPEYLCYLYITKKPLHFRREL